MKDGIENIHPIDPSVFTDFFLQSQLNILHTMNEHISVEPEKGQTLYEAVVAGFNFIHNQQQAEIALLTQSNRFRLINRDEMVSMETLKARHIELARYNWNIILNLANKAKAENADKLDLSLRWLTRLPRGIFHVPALVDFWANLKEFDCSLNFIRALPKAIRALKSLRVLNCQHNLLESIPDSLFNGAHLTTVDLSDNRLSTMPDLGYYQSALTSLDLDANDLTRLPEPLLLKFRQLQPRKMLTEEVLPIEDFYQNFEEDLTPQEMDQDEPFARINSPLL